MNDLVWDTTINFYTAKIEKYYDGTEEHIERNSEKSSKTDDTHENRMITINANFIEDKCTELFYVCTDTD